MKKQRNNNYLRGKSKAAGQGRQGRGRGAEEEEEVEKKKLYVLFEHDYHCKYLYSLYAIDNPNSHDDMVPVTTPIPCVTTTTTVITDNGTTTTTQTTKTLVHGEPEPERSPLDPLLRFRTSDWPRRMACVSLDSKLYFLGGHNGGYTPEIEYPREVHVLDLSSRSSSVPLLSTFRDEPKEIMERGPDMQTGKIGQVLLFAADGKIFALSGWTHCCKTGASLAQFEILTTTATGKKRWVSGRKPPFRKAFSMGPYAIVNRKVIILGFSFETYYVTSYDLDSETWSDFDTSGWPKAGQFRDFYFSNGSQFIGDTLYSMSIPCHTDIDLPAVIALKHGGPDPFKKEEEDIGRPLMDEKHIFHVVRHRIESLSPSLHLIRVGDRRMCIIEAGAPSSDPSYSNHRECYMSVTLFHVNGEGVAEHLSSAHYVMLHNDLPFILKDAYPV